MSNCKQIFLFVIPSLHVGGMERVMSELVRYFSTYPELEIHLLLYGKNPLIYYNIPSSVIIHKHNIKYNKRFRTFYTLATICYLRKKIIQISPQKILSFGELWNSLILLATLGLKIPIYISDRCSPQKRFGKFHETLRKWLYPKAAKIILQTNTAKDIYEKEHFLKNIAVIGNPIRSIISKDELTRENIVISVGRLINSKHFDRLVRLFSNIKNPDWKLMIVGGDAIKQHNFLSLEKLIGKLGMKNKIILAGTCKNIDDLLLKSKIFALTSSSEGFPNVIGEAMSAGLPVVSYDCVAGPSEMINNGDSGYLIPLFDDVLFEEKLYFLMNNDLIRKKMGGNAQLSIKRFAADKICEKYYQLIIHDNSPN